MSLSPSMRLAVFFLAVAGVYGLSQQVRISTDAHLNHLQTRALVTHGDIDLDRYGEQQGFVTRRGGRLYSVYGVGVSVLAAPFYAILVRAGASTSALHAFASIPFAAGAVLVMLVLLRKLFGHSIAIAGALVLGFGTTLWPIGTTAFWQHAQVALLSTLGLLGLFSDRRTGALLAGAALGWSVFVRPPTAILFVAVAVAFLVRPRRWRNLGLFALGALPAFAGIILSNRWIWESWAGGYGTAGIGFHGDIAANVPRLLFGWWRGLLPYSPVLGLSLAGAVVAWTRRKDPYGGTMIALAAGSAASVLFYAQWTTWWGGANQFGYRYLLDVVPAMVVLSAYAVRFAPWTRSLALPLAVVSIATMAAGSAPDPSWWDPDPGVFARSAGVSPLGLAWRGIATAPAPWALRMALVALAGVVAVWAAGRSGSEPLHPARPALGEPA